MWYYLSCLPSAICHLPAGCLYRLLLGCALLPQSLSLYLVELVVCRYLISYIIYYILCRHFIYIWAGLWDRDHESCSGFPGLSANSPISAVSAAGAAAPQAYMIAKIAKSFALRLGRNGCGVVAPALPTDF
jgi:hypothetical protein